MSFWRDKTRRSEKCISGQIVMDLPKNLDRKKGGTRCQEVMQSKERFSEEYPRLDFQTQWYEDN